MALSPADLGTVADLIACDARQLDDGDWTEWERCAESRYRTTVNRAYYALFLSIKAQLLLIRDEWRVNPRTFPKRAVHKLVFQSLESILTSGHDLVMDFKDLMAARGRADYELPPRTIAERDAVAAIEIWLATQEDSLPGVTSEQWQLIADELQKRYQNLVARSKTRSE